LIISKTGKVHALIATAAAPPPAHGILEERLKPLGYMVTWKEFPGGPQLLEGMKTGAVDFAHSGEAPPIFAQAAGAPLLYIGYVPDGPKSEPSVWRS